MSPPRFWPRIAPSLWVLACAPIAAGIIALALISFDVASRRFLRNYRTPNRFEVILSIAADIAEKSPASSDVVFIGDSAGECSLDPQQFERLSGLKGVNLGAMGLVGIEGYGVFLRKYLEHHATPRAAVLSLHPRALGVPDYEFGPANIRARFMLCQGETGFGGFARDQFKCLMTPGWRKSTLQDLITPVLRDLIGRCGGMTPEQHFDTIVPPSRDGAALTFNEFKSSLWERNGFMAYPSAMSAGDQWPFPVEFPVTGENKQAMRDLIALANRYSMPLIIRLTPVLTMSQEARFDEMRDWLAQLERENSNVVVSRPELIEYPPEFHMEPMHLNTRGAEKFTAFFAEDVRRILAARRPKVSESADRNGF